MELDKIGFYTLSDERVKNVSEASPMMRCEMILTNRCNFRCPYCRGLWGDANRHLRWDEIKTGLAFWVRDGLQNVRFSGGEPTAHENLCDAVRFCRDNGAKRIAISSNGSADQKIYDGLLDAGANDFSVSLDACCSADGDIMTGVRGAFDKIIENITYLSQKCYTTVGIVITEDNIARTRETILFAHHLGVSDIRIIPAAQYGKKNSLDILDIPNSVSRRHPILRYRINRLKLGLPVRGISISDCHTCYLTMDDSVIAGGYHYPCIIYMRERGDAIGKVGEYMREERIEWLKKHNTYADPICRNNCLDVCVDYNNRVFYLRGTI
ncbi:radical SAM protein [Neomegalonema sp.]|uniref:radical SAM protein n=1 Tax=Neomegalonema sp. TaxID=2039713 RepID=UPI002639BE86|nr:radical SAM protein [Neomegalonema sp.]MDD2869643.1 radical SAM protein [Neomegalonema sp.]